MGGHWHELAGFCCTHMLTLKSKNKKIMMVYDDELTCTAVCMVLVCLSNIHEECMHI